MTDQQGLRWYRRPWIVPMFFGLGLFFAFSLPIYLPPNPDSSRLPLQPGFETWHYLLLLGHIGFGIIAIVACCLQVWPWLRQNHPTVHRRSGRVYIWAGMLPSGLLAIVTSAVAVQGMVGRIGNLLLAGLWMYTSFKGYSLARRRQFADHRRWMIRSFALCTSIVLNRVWTVLMVFVMLPFQDSLYGGSNELTVRAAAEAGIWLSWVVNAIIAEWWIERTGAKRRQRRSVPPREAPPEPAPAPETAVVGTAPPAFPAPAPQNPVGWQTTQPVAAPPVRGTQYRSQSQNQQYP